MPSAGAARPFARTLAILRKWGPHVVGAALLIGSAYVLWREFHALSWFELKQRMAHWGAGAILAALALSASSFALQGVVEWMALRWSGARLSWGTALLRSFMVNGITHSLGSSVVLGAAARAWAYERNGLRLASSAMISVFQAVSFSLGLAVMAGVGLLMADEQQLAAVRLSAFQGHGIAALLLASVILYVVVCQFWPARWRLFDIPAPNLGYASGQVALGAIDNVLAAAILWLMAGPSQLPLPTFLGAYALAVAAASLSHVPGGLGVFEATLAALLPQACPEALAVGFIGFRLTFYLAPLVLAVLLAVVDNALRRAGGKAGPADAEPKGF